MPRVVMPRVVMPRVVGILLAAGRGARFGGDKLLAPVRDTSPGVTAEIPLGVMAARHLVDALPDSLAVIRPGDSELASRLDATGLRVVSCVDAARGMGASLACGVRAAGEADGWVVALADMPWIKTATIRTVAEAIAAGADIAAPSFLGARGHPVGFARRHYAALAALMDDAGARSLVERLPDRVTLIDVEDRGILADVDTPGDLVRRPNP